MNKNTYNARYSVLNDSKYSRDLRKNHPEQILEYRGRQMMGTTRLKIASWQFGVPVYLYMSTEKKRASKMIVIKKFTQV